MQENRQKTKTTIVHVVIKDADLKDITKFTDQLSEIRTKNPGIFEGYEFIVTNDRFQVTTLEAEIIKKATELAAETLKFVEGAQTKLASKK